MTYLSLAPLPQSLWYPLHIVASRPPSKLFRNLLESSLGESFLTTRKALLERTNLILARLDELVYI
jgi:hypothetical protein